jgi:hypothetical protein
MEIHWLTAAWCARRYGLDLWPGIWSPQLIRSPFTWDGLASWTARVVGCWSTGAPRG